MQKEPQNSLERWTGEVLSQLPARRAPAGLSRRVMERVRRQAALPWYRRPWMQWPRQWRALSGLAAAGLLAALGWALWKLPTWLQATASTEAMAGPARSASGWLTLAVSLGRSLATLVGQISPLAWGMAAVVLVICWVGAVGLGTACWRMAQQND